MAATGLGRLSRSRRKRAANGARTCGDFEITLFRNGIEMDRGIAGNVLGGGPLVALRHLVEGFSRYSPEWAITPGDIVTTGTVTRAFPVNAGERWSTRIDGIPLAGMDVKLV